MRGLERDAVLRVWEEGEALPSVARALALLRAGWPDATPGELVALPLGRRDALLLRLRELTFGSRLDVVVRCTHCGVRLESVLECRDLLAGEPEYPTATYELIVSGRPLTFRLPSSADLLEAAIAGDPQRVVGRLLARCIIEPDPTTEPLDPATEAAVALRMLEFDPQAEVILDLTCGTCGQRSPHLFDINEYFWMEIRAYAQRLLQEVDALARTYGWRESDVLGLSDARRAKYLQLAT